MKEYAVVRTKEQLKQALDSETRNIIVVDEGLARNIKVVKYASKAGLVLGKVRISHMAREHLMVTH